MGGSASVDHWSEVRCRAALTMMTRPEALCFDPQLDGFPTRRDRHRRPAMHGRRVRRQRFWSQWLPATQVGS